MTRVVVAEIPENAGRELSVERSILGPDIELVHYACDGNEDRLTAACLDADAVLTDYSPFSRKVIEQLPRCRLISVAATGYDKVDLKAAADAGIRVCAIDEYCTDEVADHAMLLMLALCRRLPEYHEQVQKDKRWQFDALSGLARMRDLALGIVGFGKIGQALARRAGGFGLKLMAYDPFPNEEKATDLGVRLCGLDQLFSEANIISLNCGLSANNKHLLDASAFRKMNQKPFVINCARGALIDEAALVEALDNGNISGAGLDVLGEESPDLRTSKLTGRGNVILTPHVAFYSDASILENRRISTGNIRLFLDGKHENVRRYVL
ncbi:MAG: C-terminal binding protein [Woeseiaceae bacterium]|nr:C-terminal binding protein [Woeseiaceae bacterium]